jgi:hypothetical protein
MRDIGPPQVERKWLAWLMADVSSRRILAGAMIQLWSDAYEASLL